MALPSMNIPAVLRSPSSMPDVSGLRDYNINSCGVFGNGAGGDLKTFSVGQGGQMLKSPNSTVLAAHQTIYELIHTQLPESARLGSLGDAEIRSIGVSVEQAGTNQVTALPTTYGATQQELAEILSKVTLTLRIATEEYNSGGVRLYPGLSGMDGYVNTTVGASTVGVVRNGPISQRGRNLGITIQVSRDNAILGLLSVTSNATLVFQGAQAGTQPTTVWVEFLVNLARDIRG